MKKPLLILLLLCLAGSAVRAQHTHVPRPDAPTARDSTVAGLVARIRAATERYHDLDAAVASGYRLLGPDMPNMGEHWVHPGRAVSRTVDPERPAVLTYVRVDDEPVLTGVAYTVPVSPDASPPALLHPAAPWHFHAGNLDDEAFGLVPHAMHGDGADGPRLAMAHAWVWVENPAGVFEADHWALSYLRLGLPVPKTVRPAAAKSLFLLDPGPAFFEAFVERAGQPDAADRSAVEAIMTRYRGRVAELVEAAGAGPVDDEALAAAWASLWEDVRRAVAPTVWERLAPHLESSRRAR